MARLEQVIQLDPPFELKFRGPFDDIVASKLGLNNPTDKRVCFKVKTTAPRRYCVRPNSGVLEPHSKVTVMLMLQPFEFDPHEKNKHKFMVQTMYMPDGEVNVETLFREAEASQVMDSKLRCVFEMPPDSNATTGSAPSPAAAKDSSSVPSETASSTTTQGSIPQEQVSLYSGELLKASDEIKKLRSELSTLRQENLNLKEEKLELQAAYKGVTAGPRVVNLTQEPQPMFVSSHLILAFVMALLGFILAKWVL